MNKIVNLNKNASALVAANESKKVRVRLVTLGDGVEVPQTTELQIRPTNRACGKALPKGETLIDLQARADRGTSRFKLAPNDADLEIGDNFQIQPRKHGWLALIVGDKVSVAIGQAAPAGGSVTAK